MNKLTVRAKLAWAFGGLCLLVALIAGLAIKSLADSHEQFEKFVFGTNERAMTAHLVREAIDLRAIAARNLVLVTTPEDLALEKKVVTQAHEEVGKQLTKLKTLAEQPSATVEVRGMIAEIDRIEKLYSPVALAIVDMALKGQHEAAVAKMNGECRPLLAQLVKVSEQYSAFSSVRSTKLIEAAAADYAAHRAWLIGGCLSVLLVAVTAGLLITRSLTRDLGAEPFELSHVVGRVAGGDLTTPLHVRHGDSVSVMAAVSRMQQSLTQVVSTVRLGSEGVSTASAEIAQGNRDLSARTESQASALEETAASMEELGSTVRQNADNARQANQLAMNASTVAVQGGEVVARVVDTMKGINDSSKKIADIISVIDGIAFQTNILALNAAVEAAPCRRAGPWVRRGGRRGARAGRPQRRGGERDQEPDWHQRGAGGPRQRAGGQGRCHHERGGGRDTPGDRHHGRDQRRQQRAVARRQPGGRGGDADGPRHAAERRAGGGNGRCRHQPAKPVG